MTNMYTVLVSKNHFLNPTKQKKMINSESEVLEEKKEVSTKFQQNSPNYMFNKTLTISNNDGAKTRYGRKLYHTPHSNTFANPQSRSMSSNSCHTKYTCINCNSYGHIYRNCPQPLTSYGILLYRRSEETEEIEYLLICRRHSFGFIEVMRSHFDLNDMSYIAGLAEEMTETEKYMILNEPFIVLWNHLHVQEDEALKHEKDYLDTKTKFERLVHSPLFREIILGAKSEWKDPEWGFPKGRKDKNESTLTCAKREMFEETGIKRSSYTISNSVAPIKETFRGTDNRLYCHLYYVAEVLDYNLEVGVDEACIVQTREVSQVKWASFQVIKEIFRDYNTEKLEMIQKLDSFLKDRYRFLSGKYEVEFQDMSIELNSMLNNSVIKK